MRYLLSKLIPVPMRSTYRVESGLEPPMGALADSTAASQRTTAGQRVTTTWWQWRGHVWSVRTVAA